MKIFNHTSLLILILISSCSEKMKEQTQTEAKVSSNIVQLTEAQFQLAGIKVGQIEKREISSTIKANGMLDVPPQNMVTVSALMGGFVKKTELLQGMKVKKGQVIAVMEHPDYIQLQQDYLEASSKLDLFEYDYNRQQELASENINAAKTLQQAESNYKSTKALVEGLAAKLKMINIDAFDLKNGSIRHTVNIFAPLTGYVTQVHVNIGTYVNPADVLFKIVDTAHLHAEIIVYEKDVAKIRIGQRVRIQLSNESEERVATVYLVGKEIGPDRTIRVHGHLEKEDAELLPGMYFSALFESGKDRVNTVEEEAIVSFDGKDYVFVVRNGPERKYEMIEIARGINESGYTEVILPQTESETQLVIGGAYDLLGFLKNREVD